MTYAELKAQLDALTPEQLAMPVTWSGDEKGGYGVKLWIADEDFVYNSDMDSPVRRSEAEIGVVYVVIPKGMPQLLVSAVD